MLPFDICGIQPCRGGASLEHTNALLRAGAAAAPAARCPRRQTPRMGCALLRLRCPLLFPLAYAFDPLHGATVRARACPSGGLTSSHLAHRALHKRTRASAVVYSSQPKLLTSAPAAQTSERLLNSRNCALILTEYSGGNCWGGCCCCLPSLGAMHAYSTRSLGVKMHAYQLERERAMGKPEA